MASKVVKIGRGRTPRLKGQKTNDDHGNMPKKKKVVIPKSRKYKKAPHAPKTLSESGRKYWRDRAPALAKNNRLNLDTVTLFFQLSETWGRWVEFQELESERRKQGGPIIKGSKVARSAVLAEKAETHYFRLFAKFDEITVPYEEKTGGGNRWAAYE